MIFCGFFVHLENKDQLKMNQKEEMKDPAANETEFKLPKQSLFPEPAVLRVSIDGDLYRVELSCFLTLVAELE